MRAVGDVTPERQVWQEGDVVGVDVQHRRRPLERNLEDGRVQRETWGQCYDHYFRPFLIIFDYF
jgi:hypothetical protein